MSTCLFCGAEWSYHWRGMPPEAHRPGCIVPLGGRYVCTCTGPYCDDRCEGHWELDGFRCESIMDRHEEVSL